jgi:tRNA threonylcarbamoyladenosine biosynthesis protein TsaE
MHFEAIDEASTERLAQHLARQVAAGDVVVLEGGLGAGKTTFVRAIAYALGLHPEDVVTSPTFAVVQEYPTLPALLHADLYRIGHSDELLQLGLDDRVGVDTVSFIEWGLAHAAALPHVDLVIRIEGNADDARRFVFESRTPRGAAIVRALSEPL